MRKKIPVFLYALFLLFSSSASADTISHSIYVNQSVAAEDFLFDPALGTLNSVNLILNFNLDGVASYSGDNAKPHSQRILNTVLHQESVFQLSILNDRMLAILRPVADGPIYGDGASALGQVHFAGYSFLNLSPDPFILQSGDNLVSSASVPFLFAVNFSDSENAYTVLSNQATVGGSFYVTYDYTPVPEPSTLLLLGSGLFGLAGLGRKFKK